MTFESTIQHFFDKCAAVLSHKAAFQDWVAEVTGAPDRPVDKVELCTGMTHRDYTREEWQTQVEKDHTHHFLQVHLAETPHHQQQVVLIERIKACELAWPHSAIPLPDERIALLPEVQDQPMDFDIACILKHGSHGSDVVHDFKVEQTLDFHGKVSAHQFVTIIGAIERFTENEHPHVRFVDCGELAQTFAVDSMKVSYDFLHHPDAFEELLHGFSAPVVQDEGEDLDDFFASIAEDEDGDIVNGQVASDALLDQDEEEI